MNADSIQVVLVDDHCVLLDSLVELIGADPAIDVVGSATTAKEGSQLIPELKPDVAILDIDLPDRTGFDIAFDLVKTQEETKVVFLTGYLSNIFIEQALTLNAKGYLLKGEPAAVLIDGIKRVHSGEFCFSKEVEKYVAYDEDREQFTVRSENQLSSLTPRQLAILHQLARGRSVKQVAQALHLSEKSVDSHKYRIMHRLGIHDRVELARFAIREGLTLP